MTSCGGKKSSRNCGRILDTTRASLGKPFRILQTGNPTRGNDGSIISGHYRLLKCISSTPMKSFDTKIPQRSKCFFMTLYNEKCASMCVYLSKSTETLSMATMIDSLSGAWGSEWAGRLAGLAFSLPEEKPTWSAVTPTASATAESPWPLTPVTSDPDASTAERMTGVEGGTSRASGGEVTVWAGTPVSKDSDQIFKLKMGQFLRSTFDQFTLRSILFMWLVLNTLKAFLVHYIHYPLLWAECASV